MSFASPWALAALVLVPLALIAYVVRERRGRRRSVVAPALRAAVVPRRAGWRRHVPVVGGVLAGGVLLATLAKPERTVAVPVEQATVVITTDRSGSMAATDVAPSRIVAARTAAQDFVDAIPADLRVGAITFNQAPMVLQSPTRDHAAVRAALGSIQVAGSTATGDALQASLDMIKAAARTPQTRDAPAAIVLLSDGESVRGRDLLEVARAAKAAKVPVYTVSLGTAAGTIQTKNGTSKVPPDVAAMQQVAAITGGQSFAIQDASSLSKVYEQLGSKLAKEDQQRSVVGDFSGLALLVLAGGTLLSLRLVGRPF